MIPMVHSMVSMERTHQLVKAVGMITTPMKIPSIYKIWKMLFKSIKIIFGNIFWVIHTASDYNRIWKLYGTMSPEKGVPLENLSQD